MKILKLLNKKNLSIIIITLLLTLSSIAEDKPVDIWNIDKKEIETSIEESTSVENTEKISENSIYQMQTNKNVSSIQLDQDLTSKEVKIVGLYDPQDYGLSIDMWSNTDGLKLKKLFKNIDNYNLSVDSSEILNISLLTNAYYPNQNITKEEFLKFDYQRYCEVSMVLEKSITLEELAHLSSGVFVVDVREIWEQPQLENKHVLHAPLHEIGAYVKEIPTDKKVYVICQHGVRSKVAIEYLEKEYNFTNLINIEGGMLG